MIDITDKIKASIIRQIQLIKPDIKTETTPKQDLAEIKQKLAEVEDKISEAAGN